MLLETLRIMFDNISNNTVYSLDHIYEYVNQNLLYFTDYLNLAMTSKALYNFMKTVKFLCFNINAEEHKLYLSICIHKSEFLFYEFDYDLVKLFLSKFGYVYSDIDPMITANEIIFAEYEQMYIKEYHSLDEEWYICQNNLKFQVSPLHMSAFCNNLSIVKLFLDYGILSIDDVGNTVLHVSSHKVAKYILENHKININAVNYAGHTALHKACINDNKSLVKLLLMYGADANITNNEGCTAIFYALFKPSIINMLITKTNLFIVNNQGENILEYIIAEHKQDMQHFKSLKKAYNTIRTKMDIIKNE